MQADRQTVNILKLIGASLQILFWIYERILRLNDLWWVAVYTQFHEYHSVSCEKLMSRQMYKLSAIHLTLLAITVSCPLSKRSSSGFTGITSWSASCIGFGMRTHQCLNRNSWHRSNRRRWDVFFVTMEMILLMWQWMCLFCPRSSLQLLCPAVNWHRLISGSGPSAAMVCTLYDIVYLFVVYLLMLWISQTVVYQMGGWH